jgi:hypothetical protein
VMSAMKNAMQRPRAARPNLKRFLVMGETVSKDDAEVA